MKCPSCNAENADDAYYCTACRVLIQLPPPPSASTPSYQSQDDPLLRMVLPIGRSGLAIAAGYLGLFSFIVIPAPLALLISILALKDIKKNPKKLGKGRAIFGLVMGILGSLLLVIFIAGAIYGFLEDGK